MRISTIAQLTLKRRLLIPRRAIIVSDLHENGPGKQDNFQAGLFAEFLVNFPSGMWSLWILGDWHDFWEEPRGARILEHNAFVENMLRTFNVRFLSGNHDDMPGLERGGFEFETANLFAWHGHQLDPACRGKGTLGKIVAGFWGAIERIGLGRAFRGLKDTAVRWNNRRRKTAAKRGADNAVYLADARDRGVMLYLCGHTHRPELIEWSPGHVFGNPGSWVEDGKGYAILINDKLIELVEVRK